MGEKVDYRKVIGFKPGYREDYGNITEVYYKDRIIKIDRSLASFLRAMGKYYFLDLGQLKLYYGKILGVKNLVPIPFDSKVFIPLKLRRPRVKSDGAVGYLDLEEVWNIRDQGKTCSLSLGSHQDLKVYSSLKTLEKHRSNGEIVKRLISVNYAQEDFDLPATKGDIKNLVRELIYIREVLDR